MAADAEMGGAGMKKQTEYINLIKSNSKNMACAKCNGESFNFASSLNFGDKHHTNYQCNRCKELATVISYKSEDDIDYYGSEDE